MNLKTLFISLLALSGLFLGGCATEGSSDAMVAKITHSVTKHSASLILKVTGGAEKTSDSATQISNPNFNTALARSIEQSGLFARIVPAGQPEADFQLEVALAELQQPVIGVSMTVTVEATWTLTRASNGFVIWQKLISTSYTTDAKDAFTGIERVRLALDGAARDNIHDGITQLSAIDLP